MTWTGWTGLRRDEHIDRVGNVLTGQFRLLPPPGPGDGAPRRAAPARLEDGLVAGMERGNVGAKAAMRC